MRLDWWTVAMPIGLTLLGLLLTGPGMWSDRWGWGWVKKAGDGKGEGGGRASAERPAERRPPDR